ncbi:RNA polymerase III subunit C82, partial [Kickxella alabastrina]
MFTQQVELCRRIVLEHYGPIVETVAALLIHEGRLPLGLILRKTKLTALNVRQSLAVLIQHGIATHAEAKEGARTSIFYAVNIKAILRLQRAGLYLALVEERMGKDGLAAFRTIMANGVMSIGSVRDILGIKKTGKSAAKIKFDNVVAKLVRERFITAVTPKDTVTKVDRVMQEEAKMVDAMDIPPTAKQLMEIRRTIKERDDVEYFSSSVVGIKRAAPVDTYGDRPSKMHVQIGLDGLPMGIAGDTSIAGAEEDTVDDKQCFRAYYDRLDVLLRNQQIVNFFTEKYNVGAGAVVKAILRVSEPHTRTCREKISDVVSANQVIQHIAADAPLGDSVDTGSDMFYEKLGSANASSGKDPTSELSQTKRNEIAFALLEVLHADSSGIVVKVEERGAGQYRVNFERASATLRDQVLDDLVQE